MDYVIIVAGGQGLRMGLPVPKQFALVAGRPVLMHTIARFHEADPLLGIIVVLPADQHDYWNDLCREHDFRIEHSVVSGGETRFHSSQNGLRAIPDDVDGVVGIHDGVRPFVSVEVIRRCYAEARRSGAAIPVVPVVDTLRIVGDGNGSHNVDRSQFRAVQTPQVFSIGLLREAFRQQWRSEFTDDASVVEGIGVKIGMVEGNRENIKLTTPLDMLIAEELCRM
ncbi:MAG: 2-C-methyl-D-erythritol 4-phosphate cytidylyltransferase [Prevotella sp.]|nr:2-C-methyl-D-erythritol 4-phosphate cytidylyltransferase [Prevotella sp.]